MKVWIATEMGGEGPMHALTSKAKAKAVPDDPLIYGNANNADGKPYEVPGVKLGDKIFVTCLHDGGCCYCVGGAFSTKEAALAKAGDLPPDIVADGAEGEMEVVELTLE